MLYQQPGSRGGPLCTLALGEWVVPITTVSRAQCWDQVPQKGLLCPKATRTMWGSPTDSLAWDLRQGLGCVEDDVPAQEDLAATF